MTGHPTSTNYLLEQCQQIRTYRNFQPLLESTAIMKSSIISLATLVSLAFASPPGLAERDPVICIGCVNTQNCDPPCYVVGATPGGAGGTCECPEPGEGEGVRTVPVRS